MNEPTIAKRRRPWITGRRLLVISIVLVGSLWLTCLLVIRDSGRINAINIYNSLTPRMTRIDVNDVLKSVGLRPSLESDRIIYSIDERFYLGVSFDSDGLLIQKYLGEDKASENMIERVLRQIGLPVGKVDRHWP